MRYLLIFLVHVCFVAHGQFITNNGISILNSADLTTNGDWQNSGSIRNDGIITTSESWTNTGILNPASFGGFALNYSANKSFSAGSNSTNIGFINKTGAGSALLTGKIYVRDSLKILGGKIIAVTNADTVGVISGAWASATVGSWVDGPMAAKGSGTFVFPLGKNSDFLPIKFYNSTSNRVGARVDNAPAGYTPGEAVQSLFGFPYVWVTTKTANADTAQYIEVHVPDGLVGAGSNLVLTRKVQGLNEYEGLGSRLISSDGISTLVRSYSKALKGQFTLAIGYPGNMAIDSAALVDFHNATNGGSWTRDDFWRSQPVTNWYGITEKGGRVTQVNLPNNNIDGPTPATIINMMALKTFNISQNAVTSIPDFTAIPALTSLDVSQNNLDFSSLESNAALVGTVDYNNQAPVTVSDYNEIPVHSDTTMTINVGGTSNQYQWKLNGQNIAGANSNSYTATNVGRLTNGDYVLEITNTLVPGLLLTSGTHHIEATADISGQLRFGSQEATAGVMRLLEVNQSGGAFDTVKVVSVNGSGHYLFNNVLLRDYLVNGFADTSAVQYKKALPTWYERTIFWEEADTLFLEDNLTGVDILSEIKPDPPTTGFGEITGTFYETLPDGGRINAKARVSNAAVTVRRVQDAGRGKEETLILVAYLFTDEEGEFTFSKLEGAEYRINLQYPGYPMDTNSYITIPLVDNLFERQVGVEAEVIEGKINVKKLIITGWQENDHSMTAYPNPTTEYLYISNASNTAIAFKLFDDTGRVMTLPSQWNSVDKRWELDVKHIKPGMFILEINNNGKIEKLKILIQ